MAVLRTKIVFIGALVVVSRPQAKFAFDELVGCWIDGYRRTLSRGRELWVSVSDRCTAVQTEWNVAKCSFVMSLSRRRCFTSQLAGSVM